MRILLDTNAYSAIRRGHQAVAERARSATEVLVSSIVAGELLYGFRHGTRYERNLQEFEEFLAEPRVRLLPVTWRTALAFATISTDLRRLGRPIPTNDIWIAAHGVEWGAILVSSDRHFEPIEKLSRFEFQPL